MSQPKPDVRIRWAKTNAVRSPARTEDLMPKISRGKFDRINAVADKRGVIGAAAMDQRGSLQKAIAKAKGAPAEQVTPEIMSEFKTVVINELSQHASGVLLDPEYGLEAARHRHNAGLLLAYEKTGYDTSDNSRLPDLLPDQSVSRLLNAGADCIKILLYYDPFGDPATNEKKHAFCERIGAECAHYEAPYFLEFVSYDETGTLSPLEYARKKPEIVTACTREFTQDKYNVDVLKIEVPVNMAYTSGTQAFKGGEAAYSREEAKELFVKAGEAATRPFIYLSAGVTDAVFRETLELALEADVPFSGVLCGRATWQDAIPVYGREGRSALEAWMVDRGRQNILALNEILAGAHSWQDFYQGDLQVI